MEARLALISARMALAPPLVLPTPPAADPSGKVGSPTTLRRHGGATSSSVKGQKNRVYNLILVVKTIARQQQD